MTQTHTDYRSWRVVEMNVASGAVQGTIQTSAHRFVRVRAETNALSGDQVRTLVRIAASQARFGAALLQARLTPELHAALREAGIRLEVEPDEWRKACGNCSGSENCLHVQTLIRHLVERSEDELELVLRLRGIELSQLLNDIRKVRTDLVLAVQSSDASDSFASKHEVRQPMHTVAETELPSMFQSGKVLSSMTNPDFWTKRTSIRSILEPVYGKVGLRAGELLGRSTKAAPAEHREPEEGSR